MSDAPYDKRTRRELRDLVAEGYERRLGLALGELETHFVRWREGRLRASELNERVHEHHQGPSREIWKYYQGRPDPSVVARDVLDGIFTLEEVPPHTRSLIDDWTTRIRDFWAEEARAGNETKDD